MADTIPNFDANGLLPAGDYEVTFGYPKLQLPMWHIYRVELYPHWAGNMCGIKDKDGNELEFPSAFRQSSCDGRPRGIIKLVDGGK